MPNLVRPSCREHSGGWAGARQRFEAAREVPEWDVGHTDWNGEHESATAPRRLTCNTLYASKSASKAKFKNSKMGENKPHRRFSPNEKMVQTVGCLYCCSVPPLGASGGVLGYYKHLKLSRAYAVLLSPSNWSWWQIYRLQTPCRTGCFVFSNLALPSLCWISRYVSGFLLLQEIS